MSPGAPADLIAPWPLEVRSPELLFAPGPGPCFRTEEPDDRAVVLGCTGACARGRLGTGIHTLGWGQTAATPAPSRGAYQDELPSAVEVGMDRLWSRWETPDGPMEEVWRTPRTVPLILRARRVAGEEPEVVAFGPPESSPADVQRWMRVARPGAAVHRSWARALDEAPSLRGPESLTDAFAWARARVLMDAEGPGGPHVPSPTERRAWWTLAVAALGRGQTAREALRGFPAGPLADQVASRLRAWSGAEGALPAESAPGIPPSLPLVRFESVVSALGARTVGGWDDHGDASRIVLWSIHRLMGIRPDVRFGRLRWGPDLTGTWPESRTLTGLVVGHMTVDLTWGRETEGDRAAYRLQVWPAAGAVPIQVLFEPRLPSTDDLTVELNGSEVDPQIETIADGTAVLRFQTPLDRPLELRVQVSAGLSGAPDA